MIGSNEGLLGTNHETLPARLSCRLARQACGYFELPRLSDTGSPLVFSTSLGFYSWVVLILVFSPEQDQHVIVKRMPGESLSVRS